MQIDIRLGRQKVTVGPPDGPTVKIPMSCTIEVTHIEPYDVTLRMEWVPHEGRLGVREATYRGLPMGESVRLASINKIALGEIVRTAFEADFIGSSGWAGIVADHSGYPAPNVDALVYLLAVALDNPKPSATVATARGLAPSSGPKRVSDARKAGLIPETEPGRVSGA